jgi:hypothetical protein
MNDKATGAFMYSREGMTIDLAARLTSSCAEVDYEWREVDEKKYKAILWCNAIGEHIVGFGRTELDAVIAAHNRKEELSRDDEDDDEDTV